MLSTLRRVQNVSCVLLLTLLCGNPLWADDTEIFFDRAANDAVQPNILFVLDASGSMDWYDCDNGNVKSSSCNDGTPNGTTTRLARLKSALSTVLNNTSNVNVGLMRFSHTKSGGRVIYPISPIDRQFCGGEPCDESTIFTARSRTASSEDDAIERYSGEVEIDQELLALMSEIDADDDDDDEQNAWIGLRFPDLQIPQGATITDARVQFTSVLPNDEITSLTFHTQDLPDAPPYEEINLNISSRSRSYNSVSWSNLENWVSSTDENDIAKDDNLYESPDLSSLVQLVVDKPGWCGGNALGISINGTGSRLAASFDAGNGDGPSLLVSYKLQDVPVTGGCTKTPITESIAAKADDAAEMTRFGKQGQVSTGRGYNIVSNPTNAGKQGFHTGLRFTDINIPQNATILDATLTVTKRAPKKESQRYPVASDIRVYAQTSSNPQSFKNTKNNISNRTLTSASVLWPSTLLDTTDEAVSQSPSITSLVQTLVNQPSWNSGKSMVFVLKPDGSGGHRFYSRDSNSSKAPRLNIVYETKILTAQDKIEGPVTDVRTEIIAEMDAIIANHGTPTVGALLEAKNYFAGGQVDYGKTRSYYHNRWESTNSSRYWGRYSRVSTPSSYTGGDVYTPSGCPASTPDDKDCAREKINGNPYYISPITNECQANHIVLLTDGAPTSDSPAVNKVEALTGESCTSNGGGTCGEEIAAYLAQNDSHDLPGDQFIKTHTIGFNFANDWLKDIATSGDGNFYTADSASQLSAALSSILGIAQDEAATFVAPGATVDHFSKISHRNDIYLSLFQPKTTPRWVGNLKRYDFKGNPAELHDRDGHPAVDHDTGYFKEGSRSFWSEQDDNNEVGLGGAASRLVAGTRNIYTYMGDSDLLTHDTNQFAVNNNAISANELGLETGSTVERENLIKWALGYDVLDEDNDSSTDDSRFFIGDPLHSTPAIVTYGGTSENPDSVIFFGTNEGFLHAIDTDSGDEIFSFIPRELFSNLSLQFDNEQGTEKIYGLDGGATIWKKDTNLNGAVDTGDHVYIYTGMRRGGSSYYALDVTDKTGDDIYPEFKWQIDGGTNGTDGFAELGQTWSQPVVTNIRYGETTKTVLVFGGGYDGSQDDKLTRAEDTIGRAIYIVDADTGDLLWSGGAGDGNETKVFSDMVYSIPASPKPVDADGDGYAEQIYVGDMGGRLWRFDINGASNTLDLDGGVIADFGTDGVMSDARRFYHTPDISLSREGTKYVINIAIGSGYQAHPLNTTIDDRFYLLRYPYLYEGNDKYGIKNQEGLGKLTSDGEYWRPINEDDLFNATNNLIMDGDEDQRETARNALAASKGWLIEMERLGEKVLGSSVTFNNKVLFASYVPGAATSGCSPNIGSGIFWAVSLWDATPVKDFDGDETTLSKPDRNKPIPGAGLPPPPQTLILQTDEEDDEGNTVKGDIQIVTVSGAQTLMKHDGHSLYERVYWSEYPNF